MFFFFNSSETTMKHYTNVISNCFLSDGKFSRMLQMSTFEFGGQVLMHLLEVQKPISSDRRPKISEGWEIQSAWLSLYRKITLPEIFKKLASCLLRTVINSHSGQRRTKRWKSFEIREREQTFLIVPKRKKKIFGSMAKKLRLWLRWLPCHLSSKLHEAFRIAKYRSYGIDVLLPNINDENVQN